MSIFRQRRVTTLAILVPLSVAGCANTPAIVAIRPATITSTATASATAAATATITVAGSTVRTTSTTTVGGSAAGRTSVSASVPNSPPPSTGSSTTKSPAPGDHAPLDDTGAALWPSGNRVGVAPAPGLEGRLAGWTFVARWTATVRVQKGSWIAAPGSEQDDLRFPALTSGCDRQRFLVVWAAATDGPQITAGFATAPSGTGAIPVTAVESSVTAGNGWLAVDGCRIPAFRLSPNDIAANFSDVFVSVERYGSTGA